MINVINKSSILNEATQKLADRTIRTNLVVDMRVQWGTTYQMTSGLISYRPILAELMKQLSSASGITDNQRNRLVRLQLSNHE